jgi:ribosomal protein L7Ae-like RNA K-turn-binding protein
VSDSIKHIPTLSSSNKIKSLIIIFIPSQVNLGRVVECCRDHVRLLHDLLDGMTLAQKIVVSTILRITKILVIEDHKLHNTFLHVAFGSQSLLKATSDQTGSDTN